MNESSTQDAPPEDAALAASAPTDTGAAASLDGAIPPALAEEPPIAPGVERLPRPTGTARAIPETILGHQPSPIFLGAVAVASLVADVATKLWAESRLSEYPGYVTVVENHLMFVLAKNKGGAWGLLQGESENVRRPFFLLVSVAAIAFIVTLYRRLQPRQHALKWGLPLVLGGALGNVFDRIRYGHVIDFIDFRADAIRAMNELIQRVAPNHVVTDHWPTFNVADVAICIGVALMAVDMLTSRRGKPRPLGLDVPVEPDVSAPVVAAEGGPVPEAGWVESPDAALAPKDESAPPPSRS